MYNIEVRSPDYVCRGVRAINLDGAQVQATILPVMVEGSCHVEVILGGTL